MVHALREPTCDVFECWAALVVQHEMIESDHRPPVRGEPFCSSPAATYPGQSTVDLVLPSLATNPTNTDDCIELTTSKPSHAFTNPKIPLFVGVGCVRPLVNERPQNASPFVATWAPESSPKCGKCSFNLSTVERHLTDVGLHTVFC